MIQLHRTATTFAATCAALFCTLLTGFGFSLLGPFEPWMDEAKGYRIWGEIGGPMNIGSEYRWNVPVLTYGFDNSFLEYFGSNGVAAVESAIAVLNALPSASSISLDDYPLNTRVINYKAEVQRLVDLKATTLALLLEQFGLASAEGYTFCLRWLISIDSRLVGLLKQRNFDPVSLQPTNMVNGVLLYRLVHIYASNPPTAAAFTFPVDPLAPYPTTITGRFPERGEFFLGMTRDDIGGLRYLLSAANTNVEGLLPGVHGSGINSNNFVNIALRPGVEKITLAPHLRDALTGSFVPMTNLFIDTYITAGITNHQMLERVVSKPDFLFAVGDLGLWPLYQRTSTTNWLNHSALNGSPGGAGPGIIQPPISITFNQLGTTLGTYYWDPTALQDDETWHWGSFDRSTNAPITFPESATLPGPAVVRIRLLIYDPPPGPAHLTDRDFHWFLPGPQGTQYALQTSTTLTNWLNLTNFENNGKNFTFWYSTDRNQEPRFFRFIPLP